MALRDVYEIEVDEQADKQLSATFPEREDTVIADAGHEIGIHGYSHENPTDLSREQEDEIIQMSIDSVEKYGFLYDSSLIEREFAPEDMRKRDEWGPIENELYPKSWMEPYQYSAFPVSFIHPLRYVKNISNSHGIGLMRRSPKPYFE